MKFTIITPSLNQLPYLKRCVASVCDQATGGNAVGSCSVMVDKDSSTTQQPDNATTQHAIRVHHHIQDACSTDGSVEFLRKFQSKVESQKSNVGGEVALNNSTTSNLSTASALPEPRQPSTGNYQLTFASEADEGMYDALNKGIAFALQSKAPDNRQLTTDNCDDEIVAWLNCDEQYLPGALAKTARYFTGRPDMDAACGDALLVDPDGRLLTYRKNPPLRQTYILADHLYAQSAAMFFRSGIFDSGLRFDSSWKAVGDCDFILRVLQSGFRFGQIKNYLSACTMGGENLSRQQVGVEELKAFRRRAPSLYRIGRPVWNAFRYLEKFLRGGYTQALPLEYELYIEESDRRSRISADSASCKFRWDSNE